MSLCPKCTSLDLLDLDSDYLLGPYNTLLSKSQNIDSENCEGCLFFVTILHNSSRYANRRDELQEKIIYLSGYRLDVRHVDRQDRRTWSADDLLFDVCAGETYDGPLETETARFRDDKSVLLPVNKIRKISVNIDSGGCYDVVKQWMRDCGTNHEKCRSRHVKKILPKKLIKISSDVEVSPVVVDTSNLGTVDYLALSACSFEGSEKTEDGSPEKNVTIANAIERVLDTNSLLKSYADAITITRGLGYDYIYIAALCQSPEDDPSDLLSIFGQASLLLCADNITSSNDRLIQDRPIHNSPPLGINKDRYLRLNCLRNHDDVTYSPFAKSGWAFIERVLAPRVLHFTKRQLVWECADGWKFEASSVEDKIHESGQFRGTYQKGLMQLYIMEYLAIELGTRESIAQNKDKMADLNEYAKRLEVWYQFIDAMSSKLFTSPHDKLIVFSLITKLIDNGTFGTNLSGIFTKNIAFGLGWGRVNQLLTANTAFNAPSWSWTSINGPISHMYLDYPASILRDHSSGSTWGYKYTPKLLSHHLSYTLSSSLSLADGYSLRKGSFLELEASLIGIHYLCDYFKDDMARYTINLVLDQSPIFDCSCCQPRSEEIQKAGRAEFEKRKDHYVAMVLEGDWDIEDEDEDGDQEGTKKRLSRNIDMLVLRMDMEIGEEEKEEAKTDNDDGVIDTSSKVKADGGKEIYERVGLLRLSFWNHNVNGEETSLQEKFDGVGWDRKTIKLV